MQNYNRGRQQFEKQNYKQAIVLFTRSINADRSNSDAFIYRGLSHEAINSYQSAIADYSFAIEVDPNNAIAYYNRANVRKEFGDIEQARADYTTAIELDPSYTMAYIGRGSMNQELKKYREALEDYTSAVELDRNLLAAYIGRGIVNEALQNYQEAVDDYSEAIRLDDQCVTAYYNRALIYDSLGQYGQALQDYSKAIELDNKDSLTYYNRALMYYKIKNYKEALRDNTKVIELDPQHAMAYNNRGIVLETMGDNKGALQDYTKAIMLDSNQPNFRVNRGILYQKIRNYKSAEEDFQQAFLIDPGNPIYLFYLADNEPESVKARRHLQKGLETFNSMPQDSIKEIFKISDSAISKTKDDINIFYQVLNRLDNAQKKAEKMNKKEIAKETFELRDAIKVRFIGKMKKLQKKDEQQNQYKSPLPVVKQNEQKQIKNIQKQLTQMDKQIASGLFQYGQYKGSYITKREQNNQRQSYNLASNSNPTDRNSKDTIINRVNSQDAEDNNRYGFGQNRRSMPINNQQKNQIYANQSINRNSKKSYDEMSNNQQQSENRNSYGFGQNRRSMPINNQQKNQISLRDQISRMNKEEAQVEQIDNNQSDAESMRSSVWARQNNENNRRNMEKPRQQSKVQVVESHYITENNKNLLLDQQTSFMTKNLYNLGNNISVEKYRIKQQIDKVDKNVPQYQRVKEKIKEISQFSLRQYYDCILSFLYNHLIGYRIIYSVLNLKNNDTSLEAQNTFYSFSLNQPIISKIPSFGVLVQTPFQISQSFLYTDSGVLIQENSQKIGRSSLKNYRTIIEYLSIAIQDLTRSKRFNDDILQAIRQQSKPYLSMIWQKISGGTTMTQSKKLKSIIAKFSYTEQIAAAHMTLLTKAIQSSDKNYFNEVTQNQGSFSEFIRNALPPNMKIASKTAFNQADFHDMGATGIECFEDPDCRLM